MHTVLLPLYQKNGWTVSLVMQWSTLSLGKGTGRRPRPFGHTGTVLYRLNFEVSTGCPPLFRGNPGQNCPCYHIEFSRIQSFTLQPFSAAGDRKVGGTRDPPRNPLEENKELIVSDWALLADPSLLKSLMK